MAAPGAEAYRNNVTDAHIVLLDTSRFALKEEADAIATHTDQFMRQTS